MIKNAWVASNLMPKNTTSREYIEKLMYLMVYTRPNIAFTVNFLARACASPEKKHMQSVMKLVRYLKGTRTKGLFYPTREIGKPVVVDLVGYVMQHMVTA